MERLHDAVEDVHRHAVLELTVTGATSKQAQAATDALSALHLGDVDERVFPCSTLPPLLIYLYGREADAKRIGEHLEPELRADELRTFFLYGLGGTGKTTTAQAYAQDCKTKATYDAIFWIRSQSIRDIRGSFAAIATSLGISSTEDTRDADGLTLQILTWLGKTSELSLKRIVRFTDP